MQIARPGITPMQITVIKAKSVLTADK